MAPTDTAGNRGQVDPQAWLNLIGNYADDYSKAGGDWLPPPDTVGTAELVSLAKYTFKDQKSGNMMPMWKPVARILDPGDLQGREFPIGLFTPKNFWLMQMVVTKLAGGEPISDIVAADAVLEQAADEHRMFRFHVEQNDQGYTNVIIDGLVGSDDGNGGTGG